MNFRLQMHCLWHLRAWPTTGTAVVQFRGALACKRKPVAMLKAVRTIIATLTCKGRSCDVQRLE